MSRRERWAWGAAVLLLLAVARLPLHRATFGLPVSNDDAIPLMMAERVLHGELSTILWNQPYNGTLDVYLMAPGLLVASPHTVFRVYEAACGLALVVVVGLLAGAVAQERAGWIAAVLAAAGTPYMGLMAALGPPPNFLVPLLVGIVVLAALRRIAPASADLRPARPGIVAGLGLLCGLAVWDSFLALPALIGAAVGLAAAGMRPRLRPALWLAAGAAIGMAPLLVARLTGASGSTPVTALRPRWLWTAGVQDLARAAFGLFGIEVPLVIDGPERAGLPPAAAAVLAAGLLLLVALGCAVARSRPLAGWGVALVAAFALSRRTGGDEVRYLFGLTVPVLALCGAGAATLHGRFAPRRLAWLVTAIVPAMVLTPWLIGHRRLLAAWRDPAHAARTWQVPPLDAAVRTLRDAGIRSAYASLQFAGRLTVESGHAVIASQAWNERIPGDPLRFRDEVDLDPRPAWALSPLLSRGMPRAAGFRQLLAEMGGTWREEVAGDVEVFHDFRPPYDESRPVRTGDLSLRTMDGTALPPAVLDRDRHTEWTSPAAVARGSGVVVSVPARRRLSAIAFLVSLEAMPAARWVAEADGVVFARGPARFALQWVNGAPRAGRQALLIVPLRDRSLQEVRVIFQEAGSPLTIAEAFVYGPDEAQRPAAGAGAAVEAYEHARRNRWDQAESLYGEACRLEPDRASHHAAAVRAGWRAARRRWLDVESLDDGGPAIFGRR